MARPKALLPEKRGHISGQDRVYLDGRYYYLGQSGSIEAQVRYDALLATYLANGRKMPEDEPTHQAESVITVAHVTAEYRRLIDQRPRQLDRYSHLCALLEDEYGDIPADQFGSVKLAELRELFVVSGNARPTVNEYTLRIKKMFKHAVSRELIPLSVYSLLDTLDPLAYGQTAAKEYKKRQPVSIEIVKATAEFMSPQVRAIITLQASKRRA